MSEAVIGIVLKDGNMKINAKIRELNQNELGMLILNLNYISDELKQRYYKLIKKDFGGKK